MRSLCPSWAEIPDHAPEVEYIADCIRSRNRYVDEKDPIFISLESIFLLGLVSQNKIH